MSRAAHRPGLPSGSRLGPGSVGWSPSPGSVIPRGVRVRGKRGLHVSPGWAARGPGPRVPHRERTAAQQPGTESPALVATVPRCPALLLRPSCTGGPGPCPVLEMRHLEALRPATALSEGEGRAQRGSGGSAPLTGVRPPWQGQEERRPGVVALLGGCQRPGAGVLSPRRPVGGDRLPVLRPPHVLWVQHLPPPGGSPRWSPQPRPVPVLVLLGAAGLCVPGCAGEAAGAWRGTVAPVSLPRSPQTCCVSAGPGERHTWAGFKAPGALSSHTRQAEGSPPGHPWDSEMLPPPRLSRLLARLRCPLWAAFWRTARRRLCGAGAWDLRDSLESGFMARRSHSPEQETSRPP